MIKRIALLLVISSITTFHALAQIAKNSFDLKGQIINTNKLPLSGVQIVIDGTKQKKVSDDKGQFTFKNMPAGAYTLTAQSLGYETIKQNIEIDKHQNISLVMKFEIIHLQDVNVRVTGSSNNITSNRHHLSKQERQEQRGKLLGEQLSQIAGVNTLSTGSTIVKPVINGLHSNRILVLNNGVRQEGQQWGAEHAPEIDPFTADILEVVKDAQAVRYGSDALGGVILAKPSPIISDSISGQIDLIGRTNGRSGTANFKLEGGISKIPELGWRVQASGMRSGNIKTPNYFLGNTAANDLNFSTLLQYKIGQNNFEAFFSHFGTELGIFYGSHVNTIDDIRANIEYGAPREDYGFNYRINAPRQSVKHQLAKLKWIYQLENTGKIVTQYAYQANDRKEYDLRRVQSDDVPMADMLLQTQTLDLSYEKDHHTLGTSVMLQINNNVPGTGTTPIIPNFENYNFGLYGIGQQHWSALHLEYGVRYDYRYFDVAGYRYNYQDINEDGSIPQYLLKDRRHFHNVSGSAGLVYHLTSSLGVKTNLGLAWRAPSANELYSDGMHHGSGTYEIGNKNLKAERGTKWINSLIYSGEKLKINTDLFVQYIDGYIYSNPEPDSIRQTIRGTFPVFEYKQQDALFYGLDAQLEFDILPNLNYTAKISLLRAKNITTNTYLPLIPADNVTQFLKWSLQTDNYIKIAYQYVAKQHRFDIATDYTYPPASYHLFNFYANFILPNTKNKLMVNVVVENAFNRLYKDYLDRMRYFAHRPGRNISIGIAYKI